MRLAIGTTNMAKMAMWALEVEEHKQAMKEVSDKATELGVMIECNRILSAMSRLLDERTGKLSTAELNLFDDIRKIVSN